MTERIFLTEREIPMRRISNGYYYSFVEGELCICKGDKIIYRSPAESKEAYVLVKDGGKIIVRKMIIPEGNGATVAWLLGFNKWNRTTSEHAYENVLKTRRHRYLWDDYLEWEYKGKNYTFTQCNRADKKDGYHNVAAFISDKISKKEVLDLAHLFVIPQYFAKYVVNDVFGITEEEYMSAVNKNLCVRT